MKLSEFIKENKNELNSPSFGIESVIMANHKLIDYNKLSDYQRNSFIVLSAISTGRKIYYYLRKSSLSGGNANVYLYINKKPYANAFIFAFALKKEAYKDEEELRSNIAHIFVMEYTEEIKKQISTAEKFKKILFPTEK